MGGLQILPSLLQYSVGRFDPQWLKPAYQDAEDFKRLNELTKTEKKYLAGLHRRQRYAMLPEFPSNCDFKQLHMAYMYSKSSSIISVSFESIFCVSEISGGRCVEQHY